MNAKPSLLVLVAALVFALPAPAATEQSPLADSADIESIDAILKAVYEVISGDAGVKRDWDRFRSLFAPGAIAISRMAAVIWTAPMARVPSVARDGGRVEAKVGRPAPLPLVEGHPDGGSYPLVGNSSDPKARHWK